MPLPLPNNYYANLNFITTQIKDISGIQDISVGVVPRQMSGEAIALLKQTNYTRIRQKTRNLETTLRQIAENIADIITTFYAIPKEIEIIQAVDGKQQKVWTMIEGTSLKFPFKLFIEPGTIIAEDKNISQQEAMALYQMGAFGDPNTVEAKEELLTAVKYPNTERVIGRLKNKGEQNAIRNNSQSSTPSQNT